MDQKIIPLYPIYTGRSGMGAQTVEWRQLPMRWAKVYYAKGAKALEAGESYLEDTIVLTMRYTRVITERCRLMWEGRTYEIIAPPDGTRRDGTLTIKARRLDDGNAEAEVVPNED